MKKVSRTFTIDEAVAKRFDKYVSVLGVKNKSALVEKLIRRWIEEKEKDFKKRLSELMEE